jgi:hypothetical protein
MDTSIAVNAAAGVLGNKLYEALKTHMVTNAAGPVDVKYAKHYHLVEITTIKLPLGRDTDGFIHLSKQTGVGAVTIQVADGSPDQFDVVGALDTTVSYDVTRAIVLRWIAATKKWVI